LTTGKTELKLYITGLIMLLLTINIQAPLTPAREDSNIIGLQLEYRVILTNHTGIPIYFQKYSTYIAIAAVNSSGKTILAIVDSSSGRLEKVMTLEGIPLCLGTYGDSLDVLLNTGKGTVKEELVTSSLEEVPGFTYKAEHPALFSGCTKQNGHYLIYGAAVDEEGGLKGFIDILSPSGKRISTIFLGQGKYTSVLDLASTSDSLVAIVSDASNSSIELYRVHDNSTTLLETLKGYRYVSSSYNNSTILLVLEKDNLSILLIYNSSTGKGKAIAFSPEIGDPYNALLYNGMLLVVGRHYNSSLGLWEGLAALVNPQDGNITYIDYARGKQDTAYTVAYADANSSTLYAAGEYGHSPLLVAYKIVTVQSNTSTTPPATTTPGGKGFLLPTAAAILIVAGLLLLVLYLLRTESAT
jgi:hypothetical protein